MSTPAPRPQNNFPPPWLPVVVNILVATILVGAFLGLFIYGNVAALLGNDLSNWPSSDALIQTVLTGVGGAAAAVFAVTLGLPSQGMTLTQVAGTRLSIWGPKSRGKKDWPDVNQRVLEIFGIILVIAYLLLTTACVWTKIAAPTNAPSYVLDFAGPGAGVVMGAFLSYIGGLTRR